MDKPSIDTSVTFKSLGKMKLEDGSSDKKEEEVFKYVKDKELEQDKELQDVEEHESTDDIVECLHMQVELEYDAMLGYHCLGAWCNNNGFKYGAQWFFEQGNEEVDHALAVIHYMNNAGMTVSLKDISPTVKEIKEDDCKTILHILAIALEMEKQNTKNWTELQIKAEKADDKMTYAFAQKYLLEQIEEEGKMRDLIGQAKLVTSLSGYLDLELLFKELVEK